MKDIPWPIIVTIALVVLVDTMYLMAFPDFLKLVHTVIKTRPNHNIWKHKRQFDLFEAACLLADADPISNLSKMDGESRAWYSGLCEAIRLNEFACIPSRFDEDRYTPNEHTGVTAENLKAFCIARGRKPEFLKWE
jgi:hypothetical protein